MFKVLVVDDELLAREELKYVLRRSKKAEVIGEAETLTGALEKMRLLEPDIVFLDIQLSAESGLDVAQHIQHFERPPIVIFVTAYDEYALQAFELNALDYILKPFDEERIEQALLKIMRLRQAGEERAPVQKALPALKTGKLAIEVEERIVLLDMEKIIFIGLVDGKTSIQTIEKEYRVQDALVTIEKKLSESFMRVHRAFLVNVAHIQEVEPWFHSTYNLMMTNGSKVPVSRTYVKDLKQLLGL